MALASAIIGGATALGSAIYGAVKSSKANKKAQQLIQQQRDDNKRWYDVKMAQDYTQRSDVQAAIKRQRELLQEQYENARKSKVVAGGTDESVALQQQAANRALSDTATDIAAQAANYKDSVEQQYRAQDAALNQQQIQNYQQQAASTAQAASQAVNAGVNLVGQGIHEMGALSTADIASPSDPTMAELIAAKRATMLNAPAALQAEMKSNLGTTVNIGTDIPKPRQI